MSYKIIEAKLDDKWDELVNNSKNGNIYNYSYYLNSTNLNIKAFYFLKNEELRAGIVLIEKEGKIVLDDLVVYNGIIYNNPTNKQNLAQIHSEQFQIQEFIANELIKMSNYIEFSLHSSIIDIRPILWVNYGTSFSKYKVDIKYTSYLDISDFRVAKKLENIKIYNNASASRRQQIRYAIKKNYKTKKIFNIDKFIKFYLMTMERQNEKVSKEKLDGMFNIIKTLIDINKGALYASYDDKDEIGSMAFFGWDDKRAYYIFGANDPSKRNGHTGTNVLWEAFYDLSKMGINEIDLEGINSPKRGWFKLSFGGDIRPYYEISYKGNIN